MTFEEILKHKFLITGINVSKELHDYAWGLDFDTNSDGVSFVKRDISSPLKELIYPELQKLNLDPTLDSLFSAFKYDINKMVEGDHVPFHNEVNQKSPVEFVLWLTKSEYEGRIFTVKRDGEQVFSLKPFNGMICFLNTTLEDFTHGVTHLTSNSEVISITGGLGANC